MVSRVGSNQFSKRMRLQADRFEAASTRIVKTAATAALEAMAANTRVDTSKAVSNWIVTTDSPMRGDIEAHVAGRKGSTRSLSLAETLAVGRGVIETYNPAHDTDIFITNNVRYLRYIDGSALTALGQQAARTALIGAKVLNG